jgi:hypothetical protein
MTRLIQDIGVASDDGIVPHGGKRLVDTPKIPHSIVNNGNHGPQHSFEVQGREEGTILSNFPEGRSERRP